MKAFSLISLAVVFTVLPAKADEPRVNSDALLQLMDAAKNDLKLVAVGGIVKVAGKTIASASSGVRQQGGKESVTSDDKWHIGSITKSVTATMIARLVDRGVVNWDSPVSDIAPDLFKDAHAGWKDLTLQHLLTHRSGLPANFGMTVMLQWPNELPERHEARREALEALLQNAPSNPPGEREVYSNVGYTMAGFIVADKLQTTWEELVQQEVFKPLKLTSAGFGAPKGDQPWGHARALFARAPVDPSGRADNTPIIGPAGIVHMTLDDLATYGTAHLQQPPFLKPETWKHLHTPTSTGYACGWVVPKSAGGSFWHNGSNTMWYALLYINPQQKSVVALATNDGAIAKVQPRFDEIAAELRDQLSAEK